MWKDEEDSYCPQCIPSHSRMQHKHKKQRIANVRYKLSRNGSPKRKAAHPGEDFDGRGGLCLGSVIFMVGEGPYHPLHQPPSEEGSDCQKAWAPSGINPHSKALGV